METERLSCTMAAHFVLSQVRGKGCGALPACTSLRMSRGLCRRRITTTTTTTRRGFLIPGVSQTRPCSVPWRCSSVRKRQHISPTSAYVLLEDRLLVAPFFPSDALETLLYLLPGDIHHKGVVDHLVRIVSGNACCLDPLPCVAVMERLLAPALPPWLLEPAMNADKINEIEEMPSSEMNDAALLMALAPLGRVLCRCVAVHVRLQLAKKGHVADSLCRLGGGHASNASPLCAQSPQEGKEDDPCSSSFLLRGAAVLMSFAAQPHYWDCVDSERDVVMRDRAFQRCDRRGIGDRWHACALTTVVYPVVHHLFSAQPRESERGHRAARRGGPSSLSATVLPELLCTKSGGEIACRAATAAPSRWGAVRSLGRRCWWWSVLVCRATPNIPLVAIRSFLVFSLVGSVHELHRALSMCVAPCGSPLPYPCRAHSLHPTSLGVPLPCLAMLEWLLVSSVPVVRDVGDSDASCCLPTGPARKAQSSRSLLWTAELRRAWWLLGLEFSRLSAAVLVPGVRDDARAASEGCGAAVVASDVGDRKKLAVPVPASPLPQLDSARACNLSHLVRAIANVGYRLALQWVAVVTPSETFASVATSVRERQDSEPLYNASRQGGLSDVDRRPGQQGMLPTCEMAVVLQLLRTITFLRPVLSSAVPTTVTGSSAAKDFVLVDESTWCKLACLVHLVRCCSIERGEDGDFRPGCATEGAAAQGGNTHLADVTCSIPYAIDRHQKCLHLYEEQLLQSGMMYAVACASASTQKVASCAGEGVRVSGEAAAVDKNTAVHFSAAHIAVPRHSDVSAEFLCALLKFWRTWTMDWPPHLYAAWLGQMTSVLGAAGTPMCARMEVTGDRGGAGNTVTTAPAGVTAASPSNLPLDSINQQREQQCQLVQRQLCSSLEEAWAATTDAWEDGDSLDMCACWYAFSSASRAPRCPFPMETSVFARAGESSAPRYASSRLSQEMIVLAAACEDRFRCMSETWLRRLRDLPSTPMMNSMLQSRERRPMLRQQASEMRQGHGMGGLGWCPVCLPAIVSQVALRVLYRGTPEGGSGPTPNALGDSGVTAESPLLSDFFLGVVCRATINPATEELAAFQLSIVSRYVAWCEAAGMHVGWCACAIEDHCRAAAVDASNASDLYLINSPGERPSELSMPWWLLTVDGLAVGGGLQNKVNVPTILFFWEHGTDAAAVAAKSLLSAGKLNASHFLALCHHHRSGYASAIRPLMSPQLRTSGSGTVKASCSTSPGEIRCNLLASPETMSELGEEGNERDGLAHEQSIMRSCIAEWGHRYAMRLVLLEVLEEEWQRSRGAALAHRSHRTFAEQASCVPWRHRFGTSAVAREVTLEGRAKVSDNAGVVGDVTSAYRSALSEFDMTPRFVWRSDAYQPLLRLLAEKALRVVDQMSSEVVAAASATVAPLESSDHQMAAEESTAVVSSVISSSMTSLIRDTNPGQWTARVVAHVWKALRDSLTHTTISGSSCLSPYDNGTTAQARDFCFSPMVAAHHPRRRCRHVRESVLPDAVVRLESLLECLGLALPSTQEVSHCIPCGAAPLGDVAEESRALLDSLLLRPELMCTSPKVLSYASTALWPRCWASLMSVSSATWGHASNGLSDILEGFDDVAVQLDALVTFRAILCTLEHVQLLVKELVEYLCCVFVPAAQSDLCAAWIVTTPVEAISRFARIHPLSAVARVPQTTAPQDICDVGGGRGYFRFSAAVVRTFEVLCLGKYDDERRSQCVWQQWTRELLREDRILREHPFLRWTSR